MPLAKDIRTILEAAIQAPSGENAQPWSFRVSGTTIELYNRALISLDEKLLPDYHSEQAVGDRKHTADEFKKIFGL